ncbi:hypothetical protein [Pararhizobium sp. A13]|uniref:hypothetical protein n=1 Tax=Pararhizobium sp. A13 TaxID=3133975 RepID=UPI00324DC2EF
MSSSNLQQYIDPSGLAVLRGVLDEVGFAGTEANADIESKEAAPRFILKEFHKGNSTRELLISAIKRRGESSHGELQTPQQSKNQAVDRWDNEGGR